MRHSRFRDEQIAEILKEGSNGKRLNELCLKHNISPGTYYKWRSKYGSLSPSHLKQLKLLEMKNRRLKGLYAKARMENEILQEAISGKVITPSSRKNLAEKAIRKYRLSVRRACKVFQISRTAYYYVGDNQEESEIQTRLLELAKENPTFGYWKLYYLLRDEGFVVNHKKIYRLYSLLGLKSRLEIKLEGQLDS